MLEPQGAAEKASEKKLTPRRSKPFTPFTAELSPQQTLGNNNETVNDVKGEEELSASSNPTDNSTTPESELALKKAETKLASIKKEETQLYEQIGKFQKRFEEISKKTIKPREQGINYTLKDLDEIKKNLQENKQRIPLLEELAQESYNLFSKKSSLLKNKIVILKEIILILKTKNDSKKQVESLEKELNISSGELTNLQSTNNTKIIEEVIALSKKENESLEEELASLEKEKESIREEYESLKKNLAATGASTEASADPAEASEATDAIEAAAVEEQELDKQLKHTKQMLNELTEKPIEEQSQSIEEIVKSIKKDEQSIQGLEQKVRLAKEKLKLAKEKLNDPTNLTNNSLDSQEIIKQLEKSIVKFKKEIESTKKLLFFKNGVPQKLAQSIELKTYTLEDIQQKIIEGVSLMKYKKKDEKSIESIKSEIAKLESIEGKNIDVFYKEVFKRVLEEKSKIEINPSIVAKRKNKAIEEATNKILFEYNKKIHEAIKRLSVTKIEIETLFLNGVLTMVKNILKEKDEEELKKKITSNPEYGDILRDIRNNVSTNLFGRGTLIKETDAMEVINESIQKYAPKMIWRIQMEDKIIQGIVDRVKPDGFPDEKMDALRFKVKKELEKPELRDLVKIPISNTRYDARTKRQNKVEKEFMDKKLPATEIEQYIDSQLEPLFVSDIESIVKKTPTFKTRIAKEYENSNQRVDQLFDKTDLNDLKKMYAFFDFKFYESPDDFFKEIQSKVEKLDIKDDATLKTYVSFIACLYIRLTKEVPHNLNLNVSLNRIKTEFPDIRNPLTVDNVAGYLRQILLQIFCL